MNFDLFPNHESLYFKLNKTYVESFITCPICFNQFDKPMLTHCGHSYCQQCIIRHLFHSNQCPMCRVNINSESLAYNRPLESIIEYLSRTDVITKPSTNFSINPFESTGFTLGKKSTTNIEPNNDFKSFSLMKKLRIRRKKDNDLFGNILRPINDVDNQKCEQ